MLCNGYLSDIALNSEIKLHDIYLCDSKLIFKTFMWHLPLSFFDIIKYNVKYLYGQ